MAADQVLKRFARQIIKEDASKLDWSDLMTLVGYVQLRYAKPL
jgi:hypothetical protein